MWAHPLAAQLEASNRKELIPGVPAVTYEDRPTNQCTPTAHPPCLLLRRMNREPIRGERGAKQNKTKGSNSVYDWSAVRIYPHFLRMIGLP
eukprot:6687891-Pyramimonas_sp.AAC.1